MHAIEANAMHMITAPMVLYISVFHCYWKTDQSPDLSVSDVQEMSNYA